MAKRQTNSILPSAADLVTNFLRTNGYDETLKTFVREAGLSPDAGSTPNNVTIEQILQEKKTFDLSRDFEKLGTDDDESGWVVPYPNAPHEIHALPASSNILHAFIDQIHTKDGEKSLLFASTADRRLNLIDLGSSPTLYRSFVGLLDSPILYAIVLLKRYILCSSMSGKLVLFDLNAEHVVASRHDHKKYVVRMVKWEKDGLLYLATAGWDRQVLVYRLDQSDGTEDLSLGNPIASVSVFTNPESILFFQHPESGQPLLLITRRDSTFLYYYSLREQAGSDQPPKELKYLGKQNLAPHANSWVAFTPCTVALSPRDHSMAAVATSMTPHMKVLLVRLLVPSEDANSDLESAPLTQAEQGRRELAIQDREEAALIVSANTFSPQTLYSTPLVVWRPNGSGVCVNSDDGCVRFLDLSGKVAATLQGHEAGSKVRCLWTGHFNSGGRNEEVLVTGGFDQKLFVWYSPPSASG